MEETRVVRPTDGARVFDPRTGVLLPSENAPAQNAKGDPVQLKGDRGTTVPWVGYWKRRYVAGEIEVLGESGRWERYGVAAAPQKAPAGAEKE